MASPFEQICTALQYAASPEPLVRKPADDQLAQWEVVPGFYSTLQEIYLNRSVDPKIRTLAIIYLKNGIEKYWRKTAKNPIAADEKSLIRSRLLGSFDEPTKQMSAQAALVMAKVARHDFPNDWPDLLHVLMGTVQAAVAEKPAPGLDASRIRLIQQSALYHLHQVIKALSTKTLIASRQKFEQLAPEMLRYTVSLFYDRANYFLAGVANWIHGQQVDPDDLEGALQLAILAFKSIRRLVCYGYKTFYTDPDGLQFFQYSIEYLRKFTALKSTLANATKGIFDGINKIILHHGKFYLELQKVRFLSFVLAPGSIAVAQFYWGEIEKYAQSKDAFLADPSNERFIVQALQILKNLNKNSEFHVRSPAEAVAQDIAQSRKVLSEQLFVPATLTKMCQVLIAQCLVLGPDELQSWEDDPESFVSEEEADHWEYSIRRCAEKLLTELVVEHRALLTPVLVGMLQEVYARGSASSLHDIILKDAVYAAIGLCAHDLYDQISFDTWFQSNLRAEALSNDSSMRIVKRRIAELCGNWIEINCSADVQLEVYRTLFVLMQKDQDMVVRLTAAMNLKSCIDQWNFDSSAFVPLLPMCISLSIDVMKDSDEFDTKMKLLNCLAVVVERMEGHVAAYAPSIVQILPELWEFSEDQNLFRASILVVLTRLVASLRENSPSIHSFVTPLIRFSVDTAEPAHVYLLEDAIDLWLVTMQNCVQSSDELASLFPSALALLEYGGESTKKILKIIEAYVLLDTVRVLQTYARDILDVIARLVGNIKPDAAHSILRCVDIMLQTCHIANCFPAIGEVLVGSGLLANLAKTVIENIELHVVIVKYISILSRMALYDPELFVRSIVSVGGEAALPALIDAWCDKYDNISHPKQRKLCALGLATLLRSNSHLVYPKIEAILNVVTSASNELKESDAADPLMRFYEARDDDDDEASPDGKRRAELANRDPVVATQLVPYMKSVVSQCAATMGAQNWEQLCRQISPHILSEWTKVSE
ncbi:armadillo-type protein [Polychytrium aggregatum]|uniref:armadillo-type protein n=1 Tax=Polychytrium aggregatum TaxID=110093 RepID=UPI0022FE4C20|nr:armadillo-type protein [Polychytrium aggregatum]KAI9205762.1 armadillo-type protein [Polychytrium aggregatum]